MRDQCWINETIKAVEWGVESLMPDVSNENADQVAEDVSQDELEALLNGKRSVQLIRFNSLLE